MFGHQSFGVGLNLTDPLLADGVMAEGKSAHTEVPAGSGPGGGCTRGLVGNHLHLLVLGAGNPIAVPCSAIGKAMYGGRLIIIYVHYQRQDLPLDPSAMF
jgi:hypothetical protein